MNGELFTELHWRLEKVITIQVPAHLARCLKKIVNDIRGLRLKGQQILARIGFQVRAIRLS
ncbi:hypothetical protein [Endozoicomonas sp. 2B-B]